LAAIIIENAGFWDYIIISWPIKKKGEIYGNRSDIEREQKKVAHQSGKDLDGCQWI
jgi:hypothetical protein